MGSNPHTNGGSLLHDLIMPDFHEHALAIPSPGAVMGQDTMVLGKFLRDVARLNFKNTISGYLDQMRPFLISWEQYLKLLTDNGMREQK